MKIHKSLIINKNWFHKNFKQKIYYFSRCKEFIKKYKNFDEIVKIMMKHEINQNFQQKMKFIW